VKDRTGQTWNLRTPDGDYVVTVVESSPDGTLHKLLRHDTKGTTIVEEREPWEGEPTFKRLA
jgi:hypothetical protein